MITVCGKQSQHYVSGGSQERCLYTVNNIQYTCSKKDAYIQYSIYNIHVVSILGVWRGSEEEGGWEGGE